MFQEIEVDSNLYHLENVLFDLDHYKFDSDIIKLLNDLKILVDKKLYSTLNPNGYDIIDIKLYEKYSFKK